MTKSAGWYADSLSNGTERWYDGRRWTDDRRKRTDANRRWRNAGEVIVMPLIVIAAIMGGGLLGLLMLFVDTTMRTASLG